MKKTIAGMGLAALALGGCSGLDSAIASPQLTPISNPATIAGSQRVSMPLPAPEMEAQAPNSLWRTGARSFFNDQRASKIGDILTVNIEIQDSAQTQQFDGAHAHKLDRRWHPGIAGSGGRDPERPARRAFARPGDRL